MSIQGRRKKVIVPYTHHGKHSRIRHLLDNLRNNDMRVLHEIKCLVSPSSDDFIRYHSLSINIIHILEVKNASRMPTNA